MNFAQEALIISRAELGRAVRSGRVVVLLGMYALFSLLALLGVGGFISFVRGQLQQQTGSDAAAAEALNAQLSDSLMGIAIGDAAAASGGMSALPVVVLIVFRITLFFLPVYVALMGFDQLAGEMAPRSIRYLVVRARRESILSGKFLVQAGLLIGLVLVVDLCITIYALIVEPDFPLGAAVPGLVKLWLAASIFSLAYVALTALCSAVTRSPAVSLALNFLLLLMFWLADAIGSGRAALAKVAGEEAPATAMLRYLSPSHYSTGLLDPDLSNFMVAVGAYAAFASLFMALALLALRVRDV